MRTYFQKIEQFILTQNIWIFLAVISFVSIKLFFQGDFDPTWNNYFQFVGKYSLLMSPVLLFVLFREKVISVIPKYAYWVIWLALFIGYPNLIEVLSWEQLVAEGGLGMAMIRLMGFSFLVVELGIQASEFWQLKGKNFKWPQNVSLEKVIWIGMALFSILYLIFGIIQGQDIKLTFFGLLLPVIQIFLILIPYYCFYWINHYFLVDKLLKKKGIIYYIFGFFATVFLLYPVAAQIIWLIPLARTGGVHPVQDGNVFADINMLVPFLGMLMTIPFIFVVRWFRQSNKMLELEQQKSSAELGLLKQQINPHFFFNTLNNLYSLSLTKDEKTPEVILQLSELMRYVIYKGKQEFVFLEEEIKYIEDYIRLQKIRLHKKLTIEFEKDIVDGKLKIPPLLFIIFVENAFKHGIEPAENPCFIKLKLKATATELFFSCETP